MEICSLSKLTVEIPPARELVGDGQGEVCLSPTYLLQGRPVGPGERISFAHAGGFQCQGCGKTVKSLLRGFCYPCGTRKAAADLCVLSPDRCHFLQGTCREPDWGLAHCYQPHVLYLAASSKLKVGITRLGQVPTRWVDQGAGLACALAVTTSRHQAGVLEKLLGAEFGETTYWRSMLLQGNSTMDAGEFEEARTRALERLTQTPKSRWAVASPGGADASSVELLPRSPRLKLTYPWPKDVNLPKRSLTLEDGPIAGKVLGIKGQYVLLESGTWNVRRHEGYLVEETR